VGSNSTFGIGAAEIDVLEVFRNGPSESTIIRPTVRGITSVREVEEFERVSARVVSIEPSSTGVQAASMR
jgi:hypothetical protein